MTNDNQQLPGGLRCWQQRGCDDEMSSYCPHAVASIDGVCPAECCYTVCQRGQRQISSDIDLLLDPDVDRRAAIKENCLNCAFFLRNAPRLASRVLEPGA